VKNSHLHDGRRIKTKTKKLWKFLKVQVFISSDSSGSEIEVVASIPCIYQLPEESCRMRTVLHCHENSLALDCRAMIHGSYLLGRLLALTYRRTVQDFICSIGSENWYEGMTLTSCRSICPLSMR
jgi:hypothetical protein